MFDWLKYYRWQRVWPVLVLLLVALALNLSLLSASWRHDDGPHLRFAALYSPLAYFFDPAVSRFQSYAHVTPWNALFYDINLALFGLNPLGHYGHLVLLLFACAVCLRYLLAPYIGAIPALVCGVCFLLVPASGVTGQMLMTGHYVTGMLFCLLALGFYLRAARSERLLFAVVAAVFYALACLCKEIYVPLPGILLFLPVAGWRLRLRLLVPVSLVAGFYLFWRWQVLGGLGGYGGGVVLGPFDWRYFLGYFSEALLGKGVAFWFLLLFSIWSVFAVLRPWSWHRTLLLLVATLLLLLPLAGVLHLHPLSESSLRFVFALAVSVVMLWGWGVRAVMPYGRGVSWVVVVLLLVSLFQVRSEHMARFEQEAELFGAKYRSLAALPDDALAVFPDFAGAEYFAALAEAKRIILAQPGPRVVASENEWLHLAKSAPVYLYDAGCSCFTSDPTRLAAERGRVVSAMYAGQGKPLSVRMSIQRHGYTGIVSWQFSPYLNGSYQFRDELVNLNHLPAAGSQVFGGEWAAQTRQFRVRYVSPEGWAVETPLLTLEPENGATVTWPK